MCAVGLRSFVVVALSNSYICNFNDDDIFVNWLAPFWTRLLKTYRLGQPIGTVTIISRFQEELTKRAGIH